MFNFKDHLSGTSLRDGNQPFNPRERERERGQCAVYYTGPQSFFTTLGTLVNFDWLIY